jgi:hypothetical protein
LKANSSLSVVATKIALGGFPKFITAVQSQESPIEFVETHAVSKLYSMTKHDLGKALEEFSEFDHVVLRLSGENPMEFIALLRIYGLLDVFMRRTYSASFWSMDSHHLGKHEAKAARFFDHTFIAHSEYLHLFDEKTATHLPCAFSLASNFRVSQTLAAFLRSKKGQTKKGSICAPFSAYPWQSRNLGYLKGMWAAQDLGVENFFGSVRRGHQPNEGLIQSILSSSVVLNLSLSNDLNMRNFEALALNKVLLTNHVSDHEILDAFRQNIVFLKPDLSDLKERMIEALAIQPRDISAEFLESHSLWPRIEEILKVIIARPSDSSPPTIPRLTLFDKAEQFSEPAEVVFTSYGPNYLLARSRWISAGDFRKVFEKSGTRLGTIVSVFSVWSLCLAAHVLARTIRRLPLIRASLRASRARFLL